MIIIGKDTMYKGYILRTHEDGTWLIKDGEYITACASITECKNLIDDKNYT